MKKLRFVCAGGWHTHAFDFPLDRAVKKAPHIDKEFVAVWDNDPERGKDWAKAVGCAFTESYDDLLKTPNIDGVLITCETVMHEELILKAADAGINVFVEKALTTSNESAYRIRAAVKKSGIKFTISDPVRHGDLIYAKNLVDSGRIGKPVYVKSRMGSNPAVTDPESIKRFYDTSKSGGGIMMDMNYHNVHRIQWLLGKPIRCAAVLLPFTDYGKEMNADENSVAIYEFEGGAIGVAETSWLIENARVIEVYGTNGAIKSDDAGFRYKTNGGEWTIVPAEELPEEDVYPLRYWMECILNDEPTVKYGIDDAVIYTEMISAAYKNNSNITEV